MLSRAGDAAVQLQPDRLGNDLSGRYLGLELEPVLATENRVAGWNATWDEKGQQLSYEYVGLDGAPTAEEDGVSRFVYRYSAVGDLIERRFQAADGKLTLSSDGIAGWTSKFDEHHHEVERTFLDRSGQPAASPKLLFAIQRMQYDDRGHLSRDSYFGLDGCPALSNDGYASEQMVYDNQGNEIESSFFDENGKPTQAKEAAKVIMTYNKYGKQIERRFYGIDGKLIKNPSTGRAIVRTGYDDAGRQISEASFDENDRPVDRLGLKWSKKITTYDQSGKATRACTTVSGRIVNRQPMH